MIIINMYELDSLAEILAEHMGTEWREAQYDLKVLFVALNDELEIGEIKKFTSGDSTSPTVKIEKIGDGVFSLSIEQAPEPS